MGSPQISFRLSAYQLARGLKILRTLEPKHTPTSLSQLVKTLYLDYMAKTSLTKTDVVTEADIAEIHNLVQNKSKAMSFSDFQTITATTEAEAEYALDEPESEEPIDTVDEIYPQAPEPSPEALDNEPEPESEITSVSDFSPPEDWKE